MVRGGRRQPGMLQHQQDGVLRAGGTYCGIKLVWEAGGKCRKEFPAQHQGSCGSEHLLVPWDGGVRSREVTELLLLKWGGANLRSIKQHCLNWGRCPPPRGGIWLGELGTTHPGDVLAT